jgi:hypothetical protein
VTYPTPYYGQYYLLGYVGLIAKKEKKCYSRSSSSKNGYVRPAIYARSMCYVKLIANNMCLNTLVNVDNLWEKVAQQPPVIHQNPSIPPATR